MSAAEVGACSDRISGAMYSGVPMAPVMWEAEKVSQMRATPKSASRGTTVSGTSPPGATPTMTVSAGSPPRLGRELSRTLAGLMSRWITPA